MVTQSLDFLRREKRVSQLVVHDETVMQYIVRRIHIARIAETYRQHLLGIESVKFLSG